MASEQCALRATQHFGAGHVEKTEIADHRTPDIDAVNVDADGCIGEGIRAVLRLAANGKVDARGGAGAASADRACRSTARKVGHLRDLLWQPRFITERGYLVPGGPKHLARTACRPQHFLTATANARESSAWGKGWAD